MNRRALFLLLFFEGVVLISLFLYSNRNGLGLTHDSHYYLRESQGQHFFGQQRFLVFLLHAVDRELHLVKYGFLFCYLLGFYVLAYVGSKAIEDRLLQICFHVVLIFNTAGLMTHAFLWTEPFFILSINGLLLLLWLQSRAISWRYYILMCFCLLMSIWQRKAGLLFSGGLFLGLLFFQWKWTLPYKMLISILAFLLILFFYGYFGGPNLIGERPIFEGMGRRLLVNLDGMSLWLLPGQISFSLRLILLVATLLLMIIFISSQGPDRSFWRISMSLLLFYFIVRLFFQRDVPSETERYLAPVYGIYFLCLVKSLEWLLAFLGKRKFAAIAFLAVWLLYPVVRTIKNAHFWSKRGEAETIINR